MKFLIPPWLAKAMKQEGAPLPINCEVWAGPAPQQPKPPRSLTMNRTPMKPGKGFKRTPLATTIRLRDREPLPPRLTPICPVLASRAPDFRLPASPIPKEGAIEHEGYRRLVAARPCIHCGKERRSQHAHENEIKGKSLKLDDRRAMPLCCDEPGAEGCHTKFDSYRLIPGGRPAHVAQGRLWASMTRSAIRLSGWWPKNLPWMEDEHDA